MPFDADDIAMILDEDMPGYVLASVGGVDVPGLFRNNYAEAFGVAGSSPVLRIASSAAPSAAAGDAVTVGGTSYTVAGVEPDGTGMTLLRLQEA